jgi:hypothetical protein
MRKRLGRWCLLAVGTSLLSLAGCEPSPPPTEELGQIIYDPAAVPGANRKYTFPDRIQAKMPKEADQSGDGQSAEPSSDEPSSDEPASADASSTD